MVSFSLLLNLTGFNPHTVAFFFVEKTPNIKNRYFFPVVTDEICILGDKKQRRCQGFLPQKRTGTSLSRIAPSVGVAEKADLAKPCA